MDLGEKKIGSSTINETLDPVHVFLEGQSIVYEYYCDLWAVFLKL